MYFDESLHDLDALYADVHEEKSLHSDFVKRK